MKTKTKKKIAASKPPKAFVGMAIAAVSAAVSIAKGIKAKKEAAKAATAAESQGLAQQQEQSQMELDAYPEEGVSDVNYYQAGGGKIKVRNKKGKGGKGEKDLTDKEVKDINSSTGVNFNNEGANQLFARTSKETTPAPSLDFGKYAKAGYFEMGNVDGAKNSVRIKNTSANPHNRESIKPVMSYVRDRNPNSNIELDYAYNAGGGKLKENGSHDTIGGKLNPISSDMELAEGNKHESSKIDNTSGIKLIQGDKAIAEIEHDETIKDGNLVYSDRLKASNGVTFADNAEKLAKQKGKIEKRTGKGDSISKATTTRRIGMLDAAENALFQEQEEFKKANGIKVNEKVPKAGFGLNIDSLNAVNAALDSQKGGGGFGKFASGAAPYIDNAANLALTFMTPKTTKPSYLRNRQLKTKVNATPQLNSVDDAVSGASKTIMENSSNSNTARNNVASVRLKGANQKSKILADKENVENQLENRNTRFQQGIEDINGQKREGYNAQNIARQASINSAISSNFANVSDDLIQAENNKKDEAYNRESLAAFKTANDNNNGVVKRADETMAEYVKRLQGIKANGGKINVRNK